MLSTSLSTNQLGDVFVAGAYSGGTAFFYNAYGTGVSGSSALANLILELQIS